MVAISQTWPHTYVALHLALLSQWLRGCITQVLAKQLTDAFKWSLSASAVLIKLIPNCGSQSKPARRRRGQQHNPTPPPVSTISPADCQCEGEGSNSQLRQQRKGRVMNLELQVNTDCCRKKHCHDMMRIRGFFYY